MSYDPTIVDELIDVIRSRFKEPLRACHPRDVVNQIRWAAHYENRTPVLDRKSILTAVEAYFVDDTSESEGID